MNIYNMSTDPATNMSHIHKLYIYLPLPLPPFSLQALYSLLPHLPSQTPLPTPTAPSLVDPDRVDKPISVHEDARILLDVRLAGIRLVPAAALRPHLPGPRAAERGVEDEVHVLEVRVDVAAGVVGERGAPFARVGAAGRDVRRDRGAREEPDGDGLARPFGRVDAAADGVEAGAEVGGIGRQDAAALVLGLLGGVGVAVRVVRGAGHARLLYGAVA